MTGLLIVRPDTRPSVGLGHLARSLGIAAAWKMTDGQVRILVDADRFGGVDPRVAEMIEASDLPPAETTSGAHAGIDAIKGTEDPDWIVLDGYEFSVDYQRHVRSFGRLLVVDDQASLRYYDADLVLDQNVLLPGTAHQGVPPDRVLQGISYVCLRPDALSPPTSPGDGIVALLAGGEPNPPVRRIIHTVAEAAAAPVRLVAMPWADNLRGAAIEHRPFAAPLSRNLDGVSVAVAPAGSTAWELCALGIPSVLFATASNQVPVGTAVNAAGAGSFVGSTSDFDPATLADRISASLSLLIDSPDRRALMAKSGRTLIDGRGAARVVAELRSSQLTLKPVAWDDVDILFEWANDPVVRAMAFSGAPIRRADHERWLRTQLNRKDGLHWIAWLDGHPVGQVRFDRRDHDYEISVSLAERARGRRLAAPLIIAGSRALVAATGPSTVIHAQIKSSNPASLAAFETARFTVVGHCTEPAPVGAIGRTDSSASAEVNSVIQLCWSDDLSPR